METIWFGIVAVMVAVYVVLDGFDFGAGILHLFVAKTDDDRRTIFAAIGPVWDGNEVWLLAGGGTLFFAFPRVYAAGFSGFYLPLTMVLWLLMLRAMSIEFRSLETSHIWRRFWDTVFFVSSALMAIVLGAALGNVIRGVPLDRNGFFTGPLFTDFQVGAHPGVLDWYTVTVGLFSLSVLAMHGALFLRAKCEGPLRSGCARAASLLWVAVIILGVGSTVATQMVRPEIYQTVFSRPLGIVLVAVFAIALLGVPVFLKIGSDWAPFLASGVFILGMLAASATGLYPTLLRSTLSPANNLTIANSASGSLGLHVGFAWWIAGILLAIIYFVHLFHTFAGKVKLSDSGH